MPVRVKLYELKMGDKFYCPYDNLIYVLRDCTVDMNDPDNIKWRARLYKTNDIDETRMVHGMGVRDMEVYKFTHRDCQSFFAGFRYAMMVCTKYMGQYEMVNAGVDNPVSQHLTMLKEYKKWKENLIEE